MRARGMSIASSTSAASAPLGQLRLSVARRELRVPKLPSTSQTGYSKANWSYVAPALLALPLGCCARKARRRHRGVSFTGQMPRHGRFLARISVACRRQDQPGSQQASEQGLGSSLARVVADRIEEIGSGTYQYQQAVLVACYFFCEAAELDVISPLTTAWRLEWALVTDQVALLASIGYVGFAIGTFSSGPLGDSFGRRVPILIGYVGALLGALGMWTSTSPESVGAFRLLAGVSVGLGIPASLTLIAEVSPAKDRAPLISICYLALAFGALYADLGLYQFLPDLRSGDWRSLVLFTALPAALALPVGLYGLEDTPTFHLGRRDYASVERVLGKMAEINGKPELVNWQLPRRNDDALDPSNSDENAQTGATLVKLVEYGRPLVACAALDFAYNFVGFGTGYFFPLAFTELASSSPVPPIGELIISNLLAFPGLYIAYSSLGSEYGHKQVLAVFGSLEVGATVCLMATGSGGPLPLVGIFLSKLTMSTFSQTTNTVKGELFPSSVRVTALSLSGTCGRAGALLAPALIEETRGLPDTPGEFDTFLRCIIVVLFTSVTLSSALLPESKGKPLPE